MRSWTRRWPGSTAAPAPFLRLDPSLRSPPALRAARALQVRIRRPGTGRALRGEIAFMDAQIGRLTAWLERTGLDRSTVIVLVGDHGEGLGSHGEGSHGTTSTTTPSMCRSSSSRRSTGSRETRAGPGPHGRCFSDHPRHGRGRTGRGDPGPIARAVDVPAGRRTRGPGLCRVHGPQHPVRLEPLQVLRTTVQVHRLAESRALRYRRGSRRDRDLIAGSPICPEDEGRPGRAHRGDRRGAPAPQAANLDKETMDRLTPWLRRRARRGPESSGGTGRWPIPRTGSWSSRRSQRPASWSPRTSTLKRSPPRVGVGGRAGNPQAMLVLATCYKELGRGAEAKSMLDLVLKDDRERPGLDQSGQHPPRRTQGRRRDRPFANRPSPSMNGTRRPSRSSARSIWAGSTSARPCPTSRWPPRSSPRMTGAVQPGRLSHRAEAVRPGRADPPRGPRGLAEWPLARFNLGLLYEEQGKLEEARAAYANEVETYPSEFKARFNLGKILFKLGDRPAPWPRCARSSGSRPSSPKGTSSWPRPPLRGRPPRRGQGLSRQGPGPGRIRRAQAMGYFLLADIYNRLREPDKMNEALRLANSYKAQKEKQ